jgi:hypothetical protein
MNPRKMTNEALATGLELWLMIENENLAPPQKEYFEEIVWRLLISNTDLKEMENG